MQVVPARKLKIYADTSVFGGCFDDEFATPCSTFFDEVRKGRHRLVSSAVVREELEPAPDNVKALFAEILPLMEVVEISAYARELQAAYLNAGIIGAGAVTDALHVALATVSGCSAIVSWNFKHIVHLAKIPLYNGVNLVEGYGPLGIHTPQEVIDYEAEDKDI